MSPCGIFSGITGAVHDDEGKTIGTLLERIDEEYRHWKIEHDNHAYAEELANDLCEVSTENEEKFNAYLSDKGIISQHCQKHIAI